MNRHRYLLLACMLGACATTDPELTRARESWRGVSYDEIVAAWGPPNRIVKADSHENHIWVTEERFERPRSTVGFGVGVGGGRGNVGVGVGMGTGTVLSTTTETVRCERTLAVADARVVGEGVWNGDAEYCKRFGRPRQ